MGVSFYHSCLMCFFNDIPFILVAGKKFESSRKVKDEPTAEPSFKVVTFISQAFDMLNM